MIRTLTQLPFLRFGIRDRLARAVHNPDTAKPQAFEIDFFGKRYPGDFSIFIDWSVYYFGAYSIGELLMMRDQLADRAEPVVFDVGANIGHHSLFYSTIASHVHAFEPYGQVAKKLTEKIAVNGLENVTLHPFRTR